MFFSILILQYYSYSSVLFLCCRFWWLRWSSESSITKQNWCFLFHLFSPGSPRMGHSEEELKGQRFLLIYLLSLFHRSLYFSFSSILPHFISRQCLQKQLHPLTLSHHSKFHFLWCTRPSLNRSLPSLQGVVLQQEELRMRGRPKLAGLKVLPSSCLSSAWSWSLPSTTGARRSSSGASRAASSRSRSSPWCEGDRSSRSPWQRSWLGTLHRSNMVSARPLEPWHALMLPWQVYRTENQCWPCWGDTWAVRAKWEHEDLL